MAKFSQLKLQGRYLAKRFAVKEAASKALGTGIAKGGHVSRLFHLER
ncbi:holo-[acyl-carrier protein] synthase [Vibrio sp. JCM 18904]|nr:holo-[acyl-carrier protein] synthase [Vibrio sp. JCM 18904]